MTQQKQHVDDRLPWYVKYRDAGCDLAASCLNCPYPECVKDTGGRRHFLKQKRDSEIAQLYAEGKTIKDLSSIFNVNIRTIQRAITR